MFSTNLPIFSATTAEDLTKDIDYVLRRAGTVGGYIANDEDTTFKARYTFGGKLLVVELTHGFTTLTNKVRTKSAYTVLPVMVESFQKIIDAELG